MILAPISFVILAVAVVGNAAEAKIAVEHSGDVITYLWWALGILGGFSVSISTAVGSWMLMRVLRHDKDIAVIKAKCAIHLDEEAED